MSVITTDIANNVALVTLNRPAQVNALSRDMRRELAEVFTRLGDDRNVKVAILTGAGDRAFCAGLDLKELGAGANIGATVADPSDPVSVLNKFEKPIIAAINGVAITGGFELALACDVLIASSNARFADTHARLGIMPGWGLSQKLSRIIGISRAKELSFTGNFLDAATACAWGLVNRVVAPEELLPTAKKLAADMAQIELDFLIDYKSLIDSGYAQNLADALAFERTSATAANALVTPEAIEARRAAVQARGRSQ
jgi:enoyl-CoA hydratase